MQSQDTGVPGTVSPATPADVPTAQRVPTSAHFSLTVPAHVQSASERLVLALEIPETGARAFSVRDAAAVTGLSVETAGYRLRTLIDGGYIGVVHDWSPRSARVLATRDDECAPLAVLAPVGLAGPSERGRADPPNLGSLWLPWLRSLRVVMLMLREVATDISPAHPAFSPDALTAAGWVCLALERIGEPVPSRLSSVAASPVIRDLIAIEDVADVTAVLDDFAEAGGHAHARALLVDQIKEERSAWRRDHGSPERHTPHERDCDDSESASDGSCVEIAPAVHLPTSETEWNGFQAWIDANERFAPESPSARRAVHPAPLSAVITLTVLAVLTAVILVNALLTVLVVAPAVATVDLRASPPSPRARSPPLRLWRGHRGACIPLRHWM